MITKDVLWKQICLGLRDQARLEKISATVMKRIRRLKNEDQKITTSKADQ